MASVPVVPDDNPDFERIGRELRRLRQNAQNTGKYATVEQVRKREQGCQDATAFIQRDLNPGM